MRTLLTVPLAVALLGSMMLAGGCVSKKEYDDLAAANRRAQDELKGTQEALQALRAENTKLVTDITNLQNALAAANEQNKILTDALAKLQTEYDKLKAAYDKLAGKEPPKLGEGIALPAPMDEWLRKFAADHPGLVTYYPGTGMLKLSSDLTFKKGSDEVNPQAKAALKEFVTLFNIPEAAKYHVYVAGHTDDIPIIQGETRKKHPNNWYLSVHRAVSVEEQLVIDSFPPERIGAMGFGEFHPVVANAPGRKGAEANRRVELWILPPDRFLTLPMMGGSEAAPAKAAPKKAAPETAAPEAAPVE